MTLSGLCSESYHLTEKSDIQTIFAKAQSFSEYVNLALTDYIPRVC